MSFILVEKNTRACVNKDNKLQHHGRTNIGKCTCIHMQTAAHHVIMGRRTAAAVYRFTVIRVSFQIIQIISFETRRRRNYPFLRVEIIIIIL